MAWTEKAAALVVDRWKEGKSANEIARLLAAEGHGRFSRNAVIGKVHRMGYAGKIYKRVSKGPIRPKPTPPRQRTAPPRGKREDGRKLAPQTLPDGTFASVLSLESGMCKFPIGDPRDPAFAFCGRAVEGDKPYCADHCALCYEPMVKRGGVFVMARSRKGRAA